MSDITQSSALSSRTGGPSSTGQRLIERTYLSLHDPEQFRGRAAQKRGGSLRSLSAAAVGEWRALYQRVGAPWHWHDRDAWTDERLVNYLAQPQVVTFAVDSPPVRDGGMLELCTHTDRSVEIVYLGLVSELHGHGLGAWLLGEAVQMAWARGATRVWLHTCSFDGPNALPNYLARGFTIDRTETYGIDDPA